MHVVKGAKTTVNYRIVKYKQSGHKQCRPILDNYSNVMKFYQVNSIRSRISSNKEIAINPWKLQSILRIGRKDYIQRMINGKRIEILILQDAEGYENDDNVQIRKGFSFPDVLSSKDDLAKSDLVQYNNIIDELLVKKYVAGGLNEIEYLALGAANSKIDELLKIADPSLEDQAYLDKLELLMEQGDDLIEKLDKIIEKASK
jgi:hypothetical protein